MTAATASSILDNRHSGRYAASMASAPHGLAQLRWLVAEVPARLARIDDLQAANKPEPTRWSRKEELGHLVDSAANNHVRLVRVQQETKPHLPGYAQDHWVAAHAYQDMSWAAICDAWLVLNRLLLRVAELAPAAAWERTCRIVGVPHTLADDQAPPVTLGYVLDDYVDHLRHHLYHLGVATDEL